MKCIGHSEVDAVSTCARCGAGICPDCVNGTFYQVDNKPLCRKCNYEVGLENDHMFKSMLRSKRIKTGIFIVTFIGGVVVFIVNKTGNAGTASAVIGMLFCWGLGFIGNFFDKQPDNRSAKAQAKEALREVKYPLSTLIGKLLGFFIMALTSPLQIIAFLIGINGVKKQIADNNTILSRIKVENQ
ncbi:MAG: hypothetical protein LBH73_03915 [Spirochaetaceae bacterium]|jgi:hypothetical protein|nr:hypothetical protein [Spirochaetaceae bacterium]